MPQPSSRNNLRTSRKLKTPAYRSFRVSKRIKHPAGKLPSAFMLLRQAVVTLRIHWRVFAGVLLAYVLLSLVLVRGISGGLGLAEIRDSLDEAAGGDFGSFATGLALFGYLLGSSGASTSDAGGVYQTFLIIITSLAIIWALRQAHAKAVVSAKAAYYEGMYPLIPFILVLCVIGLQLLPFIIGGTLFNIVMTNGLAVTPLETFLWGAVYFLLALLSLYMVSSSLFALLIVTLPKMTPLKALRSARQLVLHRRLTVMRKLLFLPLILLLLGAGLMLPLILFLTPVAEWAFFILSALGFATIWSYLYALYRELL